MFVVSLGPCVIPRTLWDPLDLLSLWDLSGIHVTCVGPHVTRDTHVGLVACGCWRLVWDQNCLVQHVHEHTPAMKQQSWLVGSSISEPVGQFVIQRHRHSLVDSSGEMPACL